MAGRPVRYTSRPVLLVRRLLVLTAVAAAAGCWPANQAPQIDSVQPRRAFTDGPVVLRIGIGDIRPALTVDLGTGVLSVDLASIKVALIASVQGSGSGGGGAGGGAGGDTVAAAAVPLTSLQWEGRTTQALWVQTPPGLAAGHYGVQVTDPRGLQTTLAHAFEAMGPDLWPPQLYLEPSLEPEAMVSEDQVPTFLVADDGVGGLAEVSWSTSTGGSSACADATVSPPPEPSDSTLSDPARELPRMIRCPLKFAAPSFGDQDPTVAFLPFTLHARARDPAGHEVTLEIPLRFARPPTIVSFTGTVGALAGGQPFTVRGHGFFPGAKVLLGEVPLAGAVPGGELAEDPSDPERGHQLIVGLTPPRLRAENVAVKVQSPSGTASSVLAFRYVNPPLPRDVQPAVGPSAGRIRVTVRGNDLRFGATVYVGATRAQRLPLYNVSHSADNKIVACLPPGNGPVSLWVEDPVTGEGTLPAAFTYENMDGGGAVVVDSACR